MGQREFYRIKEKLEDEGVEFEAMKHERVHTSEEAAEVRDVELKTGVKAMVFKDLSSNEYAMALIPGDRKVDIEKLEEAASRRLKLASPEKVKNRINCEVGSIPPFGFKRPLKTYMDRKIMENDRVNFSAGLHTKSIQMAAKDLKDIIEPIMCDISEEGR